MSTFSILQVVYYYPDMDIAILKEVVAQNPYRNNAKWTSVTEVANATIQQTHPETPDIIERSLKERVATLLKHFERDNNTQLKKCVFSIDANNSVIDMCIAVVVVQAFLFLVLHDSCLFLFFFHRSGTEEHLKEKKKLLQDIYDLRRDGDECKCVQALARKAEQDAKKRSADLRLVAMCNSRAGTRICFLLCFSLVGAMCFCLSN